MFVFNYYVIIKLLTYLGLNVRLTRNIRSSYSSSLIGRYCKQISYKFQYFSKVYCLIEFESVIVLNG